MAPGGFENIFQNVFFKLISWIDTLSNSCETALRSMPQNLSDDKSTLVQVMAWCRQAASHYLSQCCPRSLSPYGVTRPQWVKWNFNQNPQIFIQENTFKIFLFETSAIFILVLCKVKLPGWQPCLNSLTCSFSTQWVSNTEKTLVGFLHPNVDCYMIQNYLHYPS